jgi:hypothetical protein
LVALGKGDVRELLRSPDPAVVRAASRACLVAGPGAIAAAAERLTRETDGVTRTALSIVLASPEGALPMSNTQLWAWAEEGGEMAPLAIRALGARETGAGERRLDRFLASPDPVLRVHAALALSDSPEPDSASRLARAWQYETEPSVRRAIVAALSRRSEPQRIAPLRMAARLDPDTIVRETARGALGPGAKAPGDPGGFYPGRCPSCRYVAFIDVVRSEIGSRSEIGGRTGLLVTSSGIALPMVTDPDGALIAPGLPPGASSFRLASAPPEDNAVRP